MPGRRHHGHSANDTCLRPIRTESSITKKILKLLEMSVVIVNRKTVAVHAIEVYGGVKVLLNSI